MKDVEQPIRATAVNKCLRTDTPAVPSETAATHDSRFVGRHSAITNDLYSYHRYKTWMQKIRGTWEYTK
jgi:hypothetical protein